MLKIYMFFLTLVFAGVPHLSVADQANAEVPADPIIKDLLVRSFVFLEPLQYAEMHIAHGMGYRTKILYSDIEITKTNAVGRPLTYVRTSTFTNNGYNITFVVNGTFRYMADPHVLKEVEILTKTEKTPVGGGVKVIDFETVKFKVSKISKEQMAWDLSWETRLGSPNGRLTSFTKFEKPIIATIKNGQFEKVTLSGKVEQVRVEPNHQWRLSMDAGDAGAGSNLEFKGPCRRIYGTTPNVVFDYENTKTGERRNFASTISSEGLGSIVTVEGKRQIYELPKCYPW